MRKAELHGGRLPSQQQPQRRSSQVFRSRELLASLTLSAEAITIGSSPLDINNENSTAATANTQESLVKKTNVPRLGLAHVSQMKVKALQVRQRACKERQNRRCAALPTTHEEDGSAAGLHEQLTSGSDALMNAPSPKPKLRQPIGTFETAGVKWKAVVDGEIEKFMYSSLRLEELYKSNNSNESSVSSQQGGKHLRLQSQRTLNSRDFADESNMKMPSAESVAAVMTPSAKVDWTIEKRYQNPTQSEPPNAHARLDDQEYKRLQFDQQLEMAECMLRKKEILGSEMKKEFDHIGRIGRVKQQLQRHENQEEVDEEALEIARKRAASLYHPNIVNEPMLIPRLPQTRKIIKEIQRHTTSEGQIKYYADKQNLFTKWKKLQTAQHHQPVPKKYFVGENNGMQDGEHHEEEEEDDMLHPFGTLSPRSLFYHECVKRQVLPEPVFSRINDVKEVKTAMAAPTGNPMSFTNVAATLIQAVHDKYLSDHDGLVTTANGKIVTKKHHLALHLQHFGLGDNKTNALSKALQQFTSIHILDLSDNRLTDAAIIPLLQNLEAASIRPLSGTNRRGSVKLAAIVGRIGSAGNIRKRGNELRKLNLSHNAVGKPGCAQIAHFLKFCTLLTHLDLSHTNLGGDEALAPLTTAIECHPTLQIVNLSYNNIGEKGGMLLGDMITQPSCGITELNVSWNQICRGGATAIGVALRTNTALKTLNLAMNRCGDDGGEQLAAAMEANTSLTELDLSRNAFGGRTAVTFAFFLLWNTSLQTLQLQDNNLGAIGTRALLRAVASGSRCDIQMSVHGVETSGVSETKAIFDFMLPSLSSPFELKVGVSPYDSAVASLLLDAALIHKRCVLSELVFVDDQVPKKPKRVTLSIDAETRTVVETSSRKLWRVPKFGVFCASAQFVPSPMPSKGQSGVQLEEEACHGLVRIIKRGFSSREMLILLDLVLNDLYLTLEQASFFIEQLKTTMSPADIVGRLWPSLIDGDNVFQFMQAHLTLVEQRRLVDVFGASTIQFTISNPTGRWTLDLSDCRQRKLALWFTMINANEIAQAQQARSKRTDSSQYGKGFNWRNASYNRKSIRLTYDFFNRFPSSGILEFDYVSTLRHENIDSPNELSDEALDQLMKQIGAEVCSIYIPLHKRKDLKYQLLFFHLAVANRYLTSEQAHIVLQYFPKNYEICRFKILVSLHRTLIDLENIGELLDRLTTVDRRKIYTSLGYLNVVNPLFVDMDYEVDFEREDEKMLLRALVDLSMASPMDVIRIESERSDVLVIYSMYQTNSVPAEGKIFFRYVSHQNANRSEWVKARQSIFKHFLCGDRLKSLPESMMTAGMSFGGNSASGSGSLTRGSMIAARPASTSIE